MARLTRYLDPWNGEWETHGSIPVRSVRWLFGSCLSNSRSPFGSVRRKKAEGLETSDPQFRLCEEEKKRRRSLGLPPLAHLGLAHLCSTSSRRLTSFLLFHPTFLFSSCTLLLFRAASSFLIGPPFHFRPHLPDRTARSHHEYLACLKGHSFRLQVRIIKQTTGSRSRSQERLLQFTSLQPSAAFLPPFGGPGRAHTKRTFLHLFLRSPTSVPPQILRHTNSPFVKLFQATVGVSQLSFPPCHPAEYI